MVNILPHKTVSRVSLSVSSSVSGCPSHSVSPRSSHLNNRNKKCLVRNFSCPSFRYAKAIWKRGKVRSTKRLLPEVFWSAFNKPGLLSMDTVKRNRMLISFRLKGSIWNFRFRFFTSRKTLCNPNWKVKMKVELGGKLEDERQRWNRIN